MDIDQHELNKHFLGVLQRMLALNQVIGRRLDTHQRILTGLASQITGEGSEEVRESLRAAADEIEELNRLFNLGAADDGPV